jgi:hypothetical protein
MKRIRGGRVLGGKEVSKDEPTGGQKRGDKNCGSEAQRDHVAHEWQLCRQLLGHSLRRFKSVA